MFCVQLSRSDGSATPSEWGLEVLPVSETSSPFRKGTSSSGLVGIAEVMRIRSAGESYGESLGVGETREGRDEN
jgi:hypothetical protein